MSLHRQKVKILDTSPESIDCAKNRYQFSRMLDKIGIRQPEWKELKDLESAKDFCSEVDFPGIIDIAIINVVHCRRVAV